MSARCWRTARHARRRMHRADVAGLALIVAALTAAAVVTLLAVSGAS